MKHISETTYASIAPSPAEDLARALLQTCSGPWADRAAWSAAYRQSRVILGLSWPRHRYIRPPEPDRGLSGAPRVRVLP